MKKNDQFYELLRKNRKHYLWNKPRKDWTEEDISNLINGVNIIPGNTTKPLGIKIQRAEALTFDTEDKTCTFQMRKGFEIKAGKYFIVPEDKMLEITKELQELKEEVDLLSAEKKEKVPLLKLLKDLQKKIKV